MAPAAAVRASVERGDPLSLRNLVTMREQVETCKRVGATYAASMVTRAHKAVAVDAAYLAAGEGGELALSAGEDSAAVEHEPETILVYCRYCHKTHAAVPREKPCAVRVWTDEATGIFWEDGPYCRNPNMPLGRVTFGGDPYGAEKLRQSRLSRWQAIGS